MLPPEDADILTLLRDPDVAVERAALRMARDFHPLLDEDACIAQLDALADAVVGTLRDSSIPAQQHRALVRVLYEQHGLRGNEADYGDPRNSYLPDVLARRLGIPITLSAIVMSVGRRAGVPVEGIGFPGHFLVRIGGPRGVLADPFFGLRTLDRAALERLAERFLGGASKLRPEHLGPSTTKAIVVRMLLNLKASFSARGDHARALLACDRLVDLAGRPEDARDRGLHALALGVVEAAKSDLEAYLEARPDAEDASRVKDALQRAQKTQALLS